MKRRVRIKYRNREIITIRGAAYSRWMSDRELTAILRGERFNAVC